MTGDKHLYPSLPIHAAVATAAAFSSSEQVDGEKIIVDGNGCMGLGMLLQRIDYGTAGSVFGVDNTSCAMATLAGQMIGIACRRADVRGEGYAQGEQPGNGGGALFDGEAYGSFVT